MSKVLHSVRHLFCLQRRLRLASAGSYRPGLSWAKRSLQAIRAVRRSSSGLTADSPAVSAAELAYPMAADDEEEVQEFGVICEPVTVAVDQQETQAWQPVSLPLPPPPSSSAALSAAALPAQARPLAESCKMNPSTSMPPIQDRRLLSLRSGFAG